MTDHIIAPYTVVIDTREQHPFSFMGFKADARQGKKPLIVPVVTAGLKSGDYSLEGYEDRIAIERKSKSDAYSTFCQGRDRFERELERLNQLEWAAVVVEASFGSCVRDPPPHTKFTPKSFYRSVRAWQIRFRGVHWEFCESRCWAERATLRLLERFWADDQERLKKEQKNAAG